MFENIKGVIRNRKKSRQSNVQEKNDKMTNNNLQSTTQIQDRAKNTNPTKHRGELSVAVVVL